MKLKTLKDIQEVDCFSLAELTKLGRWIPEEILRQEAIKWIKESDDGGMFLEDWIKFFNITEEDLE